MAPTAVGWPWEEASPASPKSANPNQSEPLSPTVRVLAVGATTVTLELVEFCRAEHGRLVGTLSIYCGDAYLAEELAQETLARVCKHWDKVRELESPGGWAHRVAMNLANSSFRSRAARRRI